MRKGGDRGREEGKEEDGGGQKERGEGAGTGNSGCVSRRDEKVIKSEC